MRDVETRYIFPTRLRRIANSSDIVHYDALRAAERPAAEGERAEGDHDAAPASAADRRHRPRGSRRPGTPSRSRRTGSAGSAASARREPGPAWNAIGDAISSAIMITATRFWKSRNRTFRIDTIQPTPISPSRLRYGPAHRDEQGREVERADDQPDDDDRPRQPTTNVTRRWQSTAFTGVRSIG